MQRRTLAAGIAAVALFAATGSATADPGDLITVDQTSVTASGSMTGTAGSLRATCTVTLASTLFDAIPQYGSRDQVGDVTSASATSCSGATVTLPSPSTWDLFVVLPFPVSGQASVQVAGMQVSGTLFGQTCLYQGDATTTLDSAGTTLTFDAGTALPLLSGGIFCGANLALSGSLTVTPTLTVSHEDERPTVSPRSLRYPDTVSGTTSRKSITVSNPTTDPVEIIRASVDGDSDAFFPQDVGAGIQFPANGASPYRIDFRPRAAGAYRGTIKLWGRNARDEEIVVFTIEATGTGT